MKSRSTLHSTALLSLFGALFVLAQTAHAFYDPSLGRWPNRDPIGEREVPNLYAFVYNNAISLIDPFGLLTKAECEALRQQIFRKAAGLLDDLRRYDPVEDAKGGHHMGGGRLTKPGGHHIEIKSRQRGLGKDITKYAKECIKCDDDNDWPPPIPRYITDMANRFIESPFPELPTHWTEYVPGTPGQIEIVGEVSLVVGVTIITVVAPEVTPVIRIPPVRVPIPGPAY